MFCRLIILGESLWKIAVAFCNKEQIWYRNATAANVSALLIEVNHQKGQGGHSSVVISSN